MKIKSLVALAFIAICTSCTNYTVPPIQDAGPQPTEAQATEVITQYLQTKLKDPGSLQQVGIVGMRLHNSPRGMVNGGGYDQDWIVAFVYNAKNSFGGYVGLQRDCLGIKIINGNEFKTSGSFSFYADCDQLHAGK